MTCIIAEIAQAHEGNIEIAHAYIDAIAKTGCNTIKFQMHIAEAESSIYEPFRIQMASQDATRFDYWKRMEFSKEQWMALKKHCDDVGLEFLCSPFSNAAVDMLEKIGVKRYKIGSGEVTNFVLLEKIARTNKPVILSSGMSSYDELDKTVQFLRHRNVEFSILQCTTAYPTQPEQFGLNIIQELKERYQVPVGFSDHSSSVEACIAAVALGAEIVEFHVVFDKNSTGPDATSSLNIDETSQLVKAVNNIQIALNNPVKKKDNSNFIDLKNIFEKSLALNKSLLKNHRITFDDLEAKKPKGYGILASDYEKVIGKRLNRDVSKWDFLNEYDIID